MNSKNFITRNFFILYAGIVLIGCLSSCCRTKYSDPVILYDHKDADGRIYIPVQNWSDYPNSIFVEAPDLPPCGTNTKSSRTWVDIYDGTTNARIYGFCALDSNKRLKDIWFMPSERNGKVYIIINDRKCQKTYKSNIVEYGECIDSFPAPIIKFDHKDADGRIYIPVQNWSAYSNDMFRQAPELPACGLNPNSSRTWVNIINADDNSYIYGFCALGVNSDMEQIWFLPKAKAGNVYIVIEDRACQKSYKSNTIAY